MSYVVSVGGDPINPNPFTYSQISMTVNIDLVWPSNTQNATYTATSWIDISASIGGLVAAMPPANEAPTGEEVVFNNYGAQTITINDSVGGNITTVDSGTTIRVWITDNSTAAGTWRVANIGSGTTSAVASMLAGYGLVAQAGTLSQSMPVLTYSTSVTLNAGSRSAFVNWMGGVGTFILDDPTTLGNNWFTDVHNSGTGTLTLSPISGTIDGAASATVSLGQGYTIATDGVNFFTSGKPPTVTTSYTLFSKSVAGSGDVTLTASESNNSILYFTGALTGNINVIVSTAVNEWIVFNNTSGAFTLTVKTVSGSGADITQGARRLINCDGTDVTFSDSTSAASVISVGTGTGLTGGPITTTGTISLANTAVVGGIYGSASTVPAITIDAQGRITNAADTAISITSSNISGAIPPSKGGTGQTNYTTGDVLYASAATVISRLHDVATGNVILSGGIGVAPFYGKVGLTTHITGTLPVGNGGTGATTLTANNVLLGNGASALQVVAPGISGNILTSNGTTWVSSTPAGGILQIVETMSSTRATTSTVIPFDNSIPQNTEGAEFTQAANSFTPLSASSTLIIEVIAYLGSGGSSTQCSIGLFVDSTAGALAAASVFNSSAGGEINPVLLTYKVASGSTSARTYKLRYGPDSGVTLAINGTGSIAIFGGVLKSGIRITEVLF